MINLPIMKRLLFAGAFAISSIGSSAAMAEDVLEILGAKDSQQAQMIQNLDSKLVSDIRAAIGNTTAEQNIFLEFIKAGQLEKALYQWTSAFKGKPFQNTDIGKATYGFLLFRSGLAVMGIETLFQVKAPEQLPASLKSAWREVAMPSHTVWQLAQIKWNDGWTKVFDLATEVKVRGRSFESVQKIEPMMELLKKTSVDSPERSWLQWQMALGLALNGDIAKAAKVLKNLMEVNTSRVGLDHMNISAARLLYQNGFLDAAIQYYQKVGKGSDFWLEAQEEMGWAYIRKGEPQNTLALTQTLMTPVFANQVGPESVFLHALAQLKVCDYPEVAKTLKIFRERFRPKAEKLVDLAKTGNNEDSQALVSKLKSGRVTTEELGPVAVRLPRLAVRDELLMDLIQTQKQLEAEASLAGDLYARSLSGGTDQVGFQASMQGLKTAVDSRVQSARAASFARVKSLAESELKEFENILQKLHIVEAELIQQISQAERVVASSSGQQDIKKGTTGSHSRDQLVFPYNGEVWFDELANYKVTIKKGCQAANVKKAGGAM
jgi:tetratricopeptide (TPR) repeat protein